MITPQDIEALVNAAGLAGFNVNANQIQLRTWTAGANHIPISKPIGTQAVYIFKYNNDYLKVGKAGLNANARYRSHHYGLGRANSSLANSLDNDDAMQGIILGQGIETWIRNNTTRQNLLFDANLGRNFLNFVEAFFILKCSPKYEG